MECSIGPSWIGCEEPGWRRFLEFCEINQLSIIDTWFQKKRHHYGSWTHPGTRCGSMNDFLVVRSNDHRFCIDTQVMRGASCCSDHHLVRAKLHFGFQKIASIKTLRTKPLAVHRLAWMHVWTGACTSLSILNELYSRREQSQ